MTKTKIKKEIRDMTLLIIMIIKTSDKRLQKKIHTNPLLNSKVTKVRSKAATINQKF